MPVYPRCVCVCVCVSSAEPAPPPEIQIPSPCSVPLKNSNTPRHFLHIMPTSPSELGANPEEPAPKNNPVPSKWKWKTPVEKTACVPLRLKTKHEEVPLTRPVISMLQLSVGLRWAVDGSNPTEITESASHCFPLTDVTFNSEARWRRWWLT